MEPLPLPVQTVYAELLQLHLSAPSASLEGSILPVVKGGRRYWVARRRAGANVVEEAIGPDTDEVRARVEDAKRQQQTVKAFVRQASAHVSMLRAAQMLAPDMASGKLLAAVAKSGFFRAGGVLGGTQAFRHYPLMLGVAPPEVGYAMTGDVDLLTPATLQLTLAERSFTGQLQALGVALDPVFPLTADDPLKWRVGDVLELELLAPVGRGGGTSRTIPGIGERVQALKYLEFALETSVEAVALYRHGALIRVPAPERYALHKLVVAALRTGAFAIKADKDLEQACWLIEVLAEVRPHDLAEAWTDMQGRGKAWRDLSARSLKRRPEAAARLDAVAEEFGP